jgi:DNA-binding NarL/FixJ family response regulator
MFFERKIMNGFDEKSGRETVTEICDGSIRDFESARVWLVDDNARFRSLLGGILNEEGFECDRGFSNPDEALAALKRETPPDMILLDIEMGKHNGLDAIRPFKLAAKETHVLMLTTFASPGARERAFREGASDFMLKSWRPDQIAMHMRRAVEFGTVAGLLTAFLSGGASIREQATAPKTIDAPRTTIAERWMAHLRGWWKFSPS